MVVQNHNLFHNLLDSICLLTSIPGNKQYMAYFYDRRSAWIYGTKRILCGKKLCYFGTLIFSEICSPGKKSAPEPSFFHKTQNHLLLLRNLFYNFGNFLFRLSFL